MNTPVGSVGADDQSHGRIEHRALSGRSVRWALVVGITVGVFFGAMACASSVAAGDGHEVHAGVGDLRTGHPDAGRHGDVSATVATDGERSTSSDLAPEAQSSTHGHPGMACMTSMQLHVPTLVVPAGADLTIARSATTPPDPVTELEPPVPRCS